MEGLLVEPDGAAGYLNVRAGGAVADEDGFVRLATVEGVVVDEVAFELQGLEVDRAAGGEPGEVEVGAVQGPGAV